MRNNCKTNIYRNKEIFFHSVLQCILFYDPLGRLLWPEAEILKINHDSKYPNSTLCWKKNMNIVNSLIFNNDSILCWLGFHVSLYIYIRVIQYKIYDTDYVRHFLIKSQTHDNKWSWLYVSLFACLMVFNATFNNISVISWRSVL
jgi:hypothetical protein